MMSSFDEAMSSYDRNRKRAAERAAARNAARDAGKTGVVSWCRLCISKKGERNLQLMKKELFVISRVQRCQKTDIIL